MSDHVQELRCEVVRAAKPHKCTICDHTIERSERHYVQVYRWNALPDPKRSVRQVRYHIRCPQMEMAI